MHQLQIDRKTWLRGEGQTNSALFRVGDGKMCCLGFLACSIGYTKDEITGVGDPSSLIMEQSEYEELYAVEAAAFMGLVAYNENTALAQRLMSINDVRVDDTSFDGDEDGKVTDDTIREEKIAALLLEAGVEVEFI